MKVDSKIEVEGSTLELTMSPSQNNWPFVINVGNSIIGVTVLAMPFCFKACGIALGSLLLLFSTWLTMKSCHLLMKAGVTSRRRSFSLLAYYTYGATGKLIVELGMIGLQLGTLVAQVVIIGDLGPAIVSKATGLENTHNLRTGLIVFLCLFVGLPLGLLKDVRTLSKTSTLCILFYAFFSFYVVLQSLPNLLAGTWYMKVNFWRMEGFFQCLPIFSFAFGCQTQLFIVYDALAEPSLKRINSIVSSAVNMCTVAYLLVGFFGYIAFCNEEEITGDIINHFGENAVSDAIKMFFVCSIAVSIPLIVFPCRASLYTLLFPQKQKEDMPGSWKIPELHFKVITTCIIVGSMIIGILVPNIEFVLGLNGATMGTLICYIFPALFFLNVMSESVSEGKMIGRIVLVFGFTILIASTYTTLTAQEKNDTKLAAAKNLDVGITQMPAYNINGLEKQNKEFVDGLNKKDTGLIKDDKGKPPEESVVGKESERQEPPIPQAPDDTKEKVEIKSNEGQQIKETGDLKKVDGDKTKEHHVIAKEKEEKTGKSENIKKKEDTDNHVKEGEVKKNEVEVAKEKKEGVQKKKEEDEVKKREEDAKKKKEEETKKKEEEEKKKEADRKQNEILEKLEQQQEEQQKLIEEQKEILEQLKEHQEKHKDGIKEDIPIQQGQVNQNLNIQQQPVLGQQNQNQVPVGQPVLNLQGQGLVNQGQGLLDSNQQQGQHLLNQQIQGQGVLNQQPQGQGIMNQQPLLGQPVQGQLPLADQELGNQLIDGIQKLVKNQQIIENQPVGNQPIAGNQQLGGNQQLAGNLPIPGNQHINENQKGGVAGNQLLDANQQLPVINQHVPQNDVHLMLNQNPSNQDELGNPRVDQYLGDKKKEESIAKIVEDLRAGDKNQKKQNMENVNVVKHRGKREAEQFDIEEKGEPVVIVDKENKGEGEKINLDVEEKIDNNDGIEKNKAADEKLDENIDEENNEDILDKKHRSEEDENEKDDNLGENEITIQRDLKQANLAVVPNVANVINGKDEVLDKKIVDTNNGKKVDSVEKHITNLETDDTAKGGELKFVDYVDEALGALTNKINKDVGVGKGALVYEMAKNGASERRR